MRRCGSALRCTCSAGERRAVRRHAQPRPAKGRSYSRHEDEGACRAVGVHGSPAAARTSTHIGVKVARCPSRPATASRQPSSGHAPEAGAAGRDHGAVAEGLVGRAAAIAHRQLRRWTSSRRQSSPSLPPLPPRSPPPLGCWRIPPRSSCRRSSEWDQRSLSPCPGSTGGRRE